jgi:hypothetical protein
MHKREFFGEVAMRGFALYCGVTLLVNLFLYHLFLRNGVAFCLSLVDHKNVQLIYQILRMPPG